MTVIARRVTTLAAVPARMSNSNLHAHIRDKMKKDGWEMPRYGVFKKTVGEYNHTVRVSGTPKEVHGHIITGLHTKHTYNHKGGTEYLGGGTNGLKTKPGFATYHSALKRKMTAIGKKTPTTASTKPKLVWVVASAPTGKYRSFSKRAWPSCYVGSKDGMLIATFKSEDAYNPAKADEAELTPIFYDYSQGVQKRKMLTAKKPIKGLKAAKKAVEAYLDNHPELFPKD